MGTDWKPGYPEPVVYEPPCFRCGSSDSLTDRRLCMDCCVHIAELEGAECSICSVTPFKENRGTICRACSQKMTNCAKLVDGIQECINSMPDFSTIDLTCSGCVEQNQTVKKVYRKLHALLGCLDCAKKEKDGKAGD